MKVNQPSRARGGNRGGCGGGYLTFVSVCAILLCATGNFIFPSVLECRKATLESTSNCRTPERRTSKNMVETFSAEQIKAFWIRVVKTETCWIWNGFINDWGYGKLSVRVDGRIYSLGAHRISYEIHKGAIPDGLCVCHSCDNPKCVNPDHLWIGTHADNSHDRDKKGRQVPHCGDKNGARIHPERMTKGEDNHFSKLTENSVREIRSLCASGMGRLQVANIFNVSRDNVRMIVLRKTWKHVQ